MTETFTTAEIACDAKETSTAPPRVQQVGCSRPMRPDRRARWQSAVLAELAEPGYSERLSTVSEFVVQAEFKRSASSSGRIQLQSKGPGNDVAETPFPVCIFCRA